MKQRDSVFKEIGDVRMVRSKRAKYVGITLKPFEGVRVSVPRHVSYREAERIVLKRSKWIKERLPLIEKLERQRTVFDESTLFDTKEHSLHVSCRGSEGISIRIVPGLIEVRYPRRMAVHDTEVQEAIRCGIEEAWRIEAKRHLVGRVEEFARIHRLSFNRVYIKNSKTRWGSCSCRNNINLSLHLMRLPDRLADYIILHELAHTVVKNHSPDFWKILNRICPNARHLDAEMNRWSLTVY